MKPDRKYNALSLINILRLNSNTELKPSPNNKDGSNVELNQKSIRSFVQDLRRFVEYLIYTVIAKHTNYNHSINDKLSKEYQEKNDKNYDNTEDFYHEPSSRA